jgi:hypothetical protein
MSPEAHRANGPGSPVRRRPPAVFRRGAHGRRARRSRAGIALATLVALGVVALGVASPVLATRLSGRHARPASRRTGSYPRRPPSASVAASVNRCPLTGLPAPGGQVPDRPALAVKVDNYPTARPQSALDQADVVFEEPVEGGLTRLVAVFQCQDPPLIGPVRSAREPDVAIADELSDPLFVHAGGIAPILKLLDQADLVNLDVVFSLSALTVHPPQRVAPFDTYVAASTMWAQAPQRTTPPAPLFTYRVAPPRAGVPTTSVHIPFSSYSDNRWTWDAAENQWMLSISGVPATTLSGPTLTGTTTPIGVANVVVLDVQTFTGPWVENSEGAHEVEVQALGSGRAIVLRNGEAITGTWHRSSLTAPPTLLQSNGSVIPLAPGETWVELVPSTVPVTVGSSASSTSIGTAAASSS